MNSFSVPIVFKNLVLVKKFIFYFSVLEFKREEEKSQKNSEKEKVTGCHDSSQEKGRSWCQQVLFDEKNFIGVFFDFYLE
jgi:hypothetical protein